MGGTMSKQDWPMVFKSNEEFGRYADKNPEVYQSYSPGGAASMLGVSRQRVHQLYEAGLLRAWVIYDELAGPCNEPAGCKASYIFISAADVLERRANPPKPGPRPRMAA